ncbi:MULTISPECIES: GNAT family N-acetyltransferase [Chryseobacterium]|uniref:Ribosomal protein S18 acetylase RimI-like enzyme n=1 Tax=Chryseobacterium camelliae TaxID=1265445 RepID=A0ABU0TMB6_9FLAO|nr:MULTISPECIES: GNAT family N-acetyltransferase [Chryseobacterium]MDT3407952.1 ribosomal protein S18 acetylase RimI-like enzyme [Pseudacidovorax intermedius]MDQ1098188.1 ribosomal protein S18 acetylase RimI-like enzyme [Chryseobacterium camelliae]MDQ1102118.1 ribosomal protein S18 acetylase RimI-like enzyme [Chryseobacterium sp. SORGH_AS_1048]MDR6085556.1 ribosomal protein S18 acetylase RimI-like enzyme [Chryseobacterium sp. SORGH_AS_0909]MDR6129918.1 ribosomal protein S18 acetylase RimI-like
MYSKLDNPVYHALNEFHEKFCLNFGDTKFYNPEVAAFGGSAYVSGEKDITDYAKSCDDFLVFGAKPQTDHHLSCLVCDQYVLEKTIILDDPEEIIQLREENHEELLAFIAKFYPYYFKNRTPELGRYFGIFKDHKLVAVTGERMQMNDMTEVSAVITDTDYLGRGYAKQLVAHVSGKIQEDNKTPFLHVAEGNAGAIKLYEKLGFSHRGKIKVWGIKR